MNSAFARNSIATLSTAAALLALASPSVFAQDFNIDVGEDLSLGSFGVPTAAYGAAAAQPGFWVGLTDGVAGGLTPVIGSPWWVGTNIANTSGVATTCDVQAIANAVTNSSGDFIFNNALTTGNDQALMDDVADCGGAGNSLAWTFSQLQNGTYNVYTYAWAPDSGTFITSVSVPGTISTNPQSSGGNWPGSHVQGVTFTKHTVTVTGGTLIVNVSTTSGFGSVNGFQLDLQAGVATAAFCFGDGTGTACPCINSGALGKGCANSAGNSAQLTASGSNSVAANSLMLTTSGMMPGSFSIYVQGTAQLGGGLGVLSAAYDGLDCIGGTLLRLGRIGTLGGTSSIGNIVVQGAIPPAGGTRHYQTVYRNQVAFCTAATLNSSNGMTVNWIP